MNTQDFVRPWDGFQAANRFRRAIRKFNSTPIPEGEVYALLAEAAYAPSSGNMQPYELHWIRDPALQVRMALACNGQKAAASAAEFVVIVASPALGLRTAKAQLAHVEGSSVLGVDSKAYYRKQVGMFQKILGVGSSVLWSPLVALAALIRPSLSLIPIGHVGGRQWAARNAIFAAQTIMLGAAAKGIDSCPMEGFSASQVSNLLQLPRGSVIPLVIALGYRADDARIEERWRNPLSDIIVLH
ncbi:nitroreductase family protein [Pseudomonas sp. MAFF 301449]|uniref:Nitroreductase family protein n=1 Tax=Pseudomonas cyclaminis TaxID=2781239 RepID=A0ABR9SSX3_9PSED|nr:nitroreductase family protein [Pseudomonas cyclaminis]MBE8591561.1 nitroreductase family protein [Pseudomonas cyclaminis]MBE8598650.1 nitroreductase family protein [Pseudomonas cyclaminis]